MANIRISDLTDLTTPSGASVFPINHQGATRKISVDNLINYINNVSTGVDPTYATTGALNSSGIMLTNTINSLSGSLNLSGITLVNTINSSGITLFTTINSSGIALINRDNALSGSLNLSGISLTNTINALSGLFTGFTGNLDTTFATDLQVVNTGISLTNTINALSGSLNLSGIASINRENALSGSLNLSGISLTNRINSLSGSSVLTYGDQNISGIKTFATGVNISGHVGIGINNNDKFRLYVRKSAAGVTVNPDDGSIAVFEGSGNSHITVLASNAQTAGVILGAPADPFGSYLSWNHDNNELKLGTDKAGGFISLLTDDETQAVRITSGGNVGIGTISPSEKLQVIGNILANNLVYNTGAQNISGAKTFFDSGIFSLSGASPLPLPRNPLSVVGSGNTYVQLNIQNRASGTNASADLVITANNGTDSTNYINLGINNSGYNDPAFTHGTGLDGYLFIDGGNLDIGTKTPGKALEFHAGGTTADKAIARISESGLNLVSGNLTVNNTGVLLSGQDVFILTLAHASTSSLTTGNNFFGNIFDVGTSPTINLRKFIIMENCIARKFSWTNFVGTSGTATQIATGYFINVTTRTTGILTTGITNISSNTQQNISGYFSPPMLLKEGDEIVASLHVVSGGTGPITTAVRNNVNIYCYK